MKNSLGYDNAISGTVYSTEDIASMRKALMERYRRSGLGVQKFAQQIGLSWSSMATFFTQTRQLQVKSLYKIEQFLKKI